MHKTKQSIYQVKQEKPSKIQGAISPAKITMKEIQNQEHSQIRKIKIMIIRMHILLDWEVSNQKEGE